MNKIINPIDTNINTYQTELIKVINNNPNITNRAFYNIILEEYEKLNKKNKNVNFDYSIEGHFVLFISTEINNNNNICNLKGYIKFNNKRIEQICFNIDEQITKEALYILNDVNKILGGTRK